MTDRRTDRMTDIYTFSLLSRVPGGGAKNCAVAHPNHVSNSHTKFGWISSNGEDSMTVGRMDGRRRLQYPHRFLKKTKNVGIIM